MLCDNAGYGGKPKPPGSFDPCDPIQDRVRVVNQYGIDEACRANGMHDSTNVRWIELSDIAVGQGQSPRIVMGQFQVW